MTIVNQLKKIVSKLSGKPTTDIQGQTISELLHETSVHISAGGGNGTTDHEGLFNRDLENQHPIKAISGLQDELDTIPKAITEIELMKILR